MIATDTSTRAFRRAAARFLSMPGVGEGTGFGSSAGLRVRGKIFAFVSRDGELVVKLPKARVDSLVASGAGTRFDPGHGRVMKEWIAVVTGRSRSWPSLMDEARTYVERGSSR